MTNIGHWGMGDQEVVFRKSGDFEKAKPLNVLIKKTKSGQAWRSQVGVERRS